jgi:TolB-like protein
MKLGKLLNFVLCVATLIEFVFAANLCKAQSRKTFTLATMPLQASGLTIGEAQLLTSRLNSELVRLGMFRVAERARVDDLLKEMGFQQSGACDANECFAQVGRMLGVQYMVGGEVGRIGQSFALEVRMIDVASGRIVKATSDVYQGPIEGLLEIMRNVALKLVGRKTQSVTVTQKRQPNSPSILKFNTLGLEIDAIPFATGGYSGSIWYGHNKVRFRGLFAKINTPDIFWRDGFEKDSSRVYALNVEYFFESNFRGFWVATGIQYWKGSLGHENEIKRGEYEFSTASLSCGYVWNFFSNLYLNFEGGLYFYVLGDKETQVGNRTAFFDDVGPIISVSLGWHF